MWDGGFGSRLINRDIFCHTGHAFGQRRVFKCSLLLIAVLLDYQANFAGIPLRATLYESPLILLMHFTKYI